MRPWAGVGPLAVAGSGAQAVTACRAASWGGNGGRGGEGEGGEGAGGHRRSGGAHVRQRGCWHGHGGAAWLLPAPLDSPTQNKQRRWQRGVHQRAGRQAGTEGPRYHASCRMRVAPPLTCGCLQARYAPAVPLPCRCTRGAPAAGCETTPHLMQTALPIALNRMQASAGWHPLTRSEGTNQPGAAKNAC